NLIFTSAPTSSHTACPDPASRNVCCREHLAAREHDAVLAARLDQAPAELLAIEVCVKTARGHELGVRAALDDAAAIEDEDHVGREDRREPVRDRDRRP